MNRYRPITLCTIFREYIVCSVKFFNNINNIDSKDHDHMVLSSKYVENIMKRQSFYRGLINRYHDLSYLLSVGKLEISLV